MPEEALFAMKKQLFVVEGKHDEMHLQSLYNEIQTISVGGSAVNKDALNFLVAHQDKFDIIILTDPDYPGMKIRQKIDEALNHAHHIYVEKKHAQYKNKVGIEHVSKIHLDEAMKHVIRNGNKNTITQQEFNDLQLQGSKSNAEKRQRLAQALHLGKVNAKAMYKMINMLGLSKEDILKKL